jgi:hypothetical protein
MKTNKVCVGLVLGLAMLVPELAEAQYSSFGWTSGRVRFHNRNSGYCPTGEDCTGARYPETSYDVRLGIPEARVSLVRFDGVVIGSGITDADGDYVMYWYSNGTPPGAVTARLRVTYEHKDGRFRFRTTTDQAATSSSDLLALTHGTSVSSPQSIWWYWGTAASPNSFANAYWAAWTLWNNRLKYSNRMLSRFTDLDIYGFDSVAPCNGNSCASCGTSCARGYYELGGNPSWANARMTVVLDANAAFSPQERVMHEMGHIADYVSRYWRFSTGYDYDGNDGWSFTTPEYRPTALHEGFASFVGTSGLYDDDATEPRTCFASEGEHCYPGGGGSNVQNIETSSYGSCGAEEGRWAISATRFFWDIYDEAEDEIDSNDLTQYQIFDSIGALPCANWPACYGSGEAHDPYSFVSGDLSQRTISCNDCGSGWSFRNNMLNEYSGGYDVDTEYFNNCLGYF